MEREILDEKKKTLKHFWNRSGVGMERKERRAFVFKRILRPPAPYIPPSSIAIGHKFLIKFP
jgi:hypothetical protein